MIIGFDAKRAFNNHTGLGNYSRYVIDNLSAVFPDNQYRLYTPSDSINIGITGLRNRNNISVAFPKGWQRCFKSLWRTKGVVRDLVKDGVQIYHGLSNELPLHLAKRKIRSIVTIHDLIFLRYPQFYKTFDRKIYTRKFQYACREADHIIAVSECTKRDIIQFFGTDPAKISVVYQGCDTSFARRCTPEEKQQITAKYRLPETFMLNVGTIEARKNLLQAVRSLLHLDGSMHLVAVGRETAYANDIRKYIRAHGLEKRVHFLSGVPLADLPALYQSATVFTYPSFFEGFGIPIIEALHSGVPVIAVTGSCLEEAGGPGSIYVDPMRDEQMAEAIYNVISDPGIHARMISDGLAYVTRFDDKLLAKQMMEVYQDKLGVKD